MLALITSLSLALPQLALPHTKYTLANGLEVIVQEDHALPLVAVSIWYHVGPVNEPPKRTGFAHLFEHLMFQGSKHIGDDQHFGLLQAAGATLVNGTTDYDRTNYFETLPANQLELALWLESDRMGFLLDTLTQAKLDNQRQVVMNERRQSVENVPYGPSDEKMVQSLFPPEHPYYGYVIGSMDDLNAATLADVTAFFASFYTPANATLAIVGDVDPAAVRSLVEKYFGSLSGPAKPALQSVSTPPIAAERTLEVKEPVKLARLQLGWLTAPFFSQGDADADVLSSLLGSGESSRLYRRLVYDLEIAQSVEAHQESLALASMFTITVTGRPGVTIERLRQETDAVLAAVHSSAPPTEREITRARNRIVTSSLTSLQRLGGFGGKADRMNTYNHYLGTPDYLASDLARYERVTPASLQEFARTHLARDRRVAVATLPTEAAP